MFNRQDKQAGRIDTLIGRTAQVLGDLEFTGGLHLDGRIRGNLRASAGSLSVSEQGIVEGSVDVPQVLLDGAVTGDIRATERLVLGARSRVEGDVHYGAIEMAPGARINGKLLRLSGPASGQGLESS
jgi:cytoskeletal protein CcmA (bactofilin family)